MIMVNPTAAVATGSPKALFVYGTLMAPDVLNMLLLGKSATLGANPVVSMKPAVLRDGFYRFPVHHQVYPALISESRLPKESGRNLGGAATPAAGVRGYLLTDLTSQQLRILDWFEGDEYTRNSIEVDVMEPDEESDKLSTNTKQQCDVYLWSAPLSLVQHEPGKDWDYNSFLEKDLQWYLDHTVRPCTLELEEEGYY